MQARDSTISMPYRVQRIENFVGQLESGDLKLRVRVLEVLPGYPIVLILIFCLSECNKRNIVLFCLMQYYQKLTMSPKLCLFLFCNKSFFSIILSF
jgi:hypothetical protein